MNLDSIIDFKKYSVNEGDRVKLSDFATEYEGEKLDKGLAVELLEESRKQLADIQNTLYADNRYAVLIVLQAMDAAGKDSAIKHIMSGFNPQGVKVHSFKTPSANELDHDYLWRHYIALPARGEIGIFNRSHYENVLVTRVHKEYILGERLPGINSVDDIEEDFWKERYKQINRFEKNIQQNGTVILKFFLNVSKKEQKKRFLERIDDPTKNWKFSAADLTERGFWDDYQKAYEQAISATSKDHAPWFVIPADNKWFTRILIARIIHKTFESLDLKYPSLNSEQTEALQKSRSQLMDEK